MAGTTKTTLLRSRSYVGKDFSALRNSMVEYARQYYADKISDLSEMSMGGLLMDFAAMVGDNLTFYLDHQFSELDPDTAVETTNIERMLRRAGVPITGATPATVDVTFYITVPSNSGVPRTDCLPVIGAGTILESNTGVQFILSEDVDFTETDASGALVATVKPGTVTAGTVRTFIVSRAGTCVSGFEESETFTMDGFVEFRKIALTYPDVSEITNVVDGMGNKYYQVSSLADDVVYTNLPNPNSDVDYVDDVISVVPAPYRFTADTSLSDRTTTITMGGGSAETFDDDAIPDPSEFAIPMKYRKTFSRISLDPARLMNTRTLGIAQPDTTLTVTYRYGGGLNHSVPENTIQAYTSLVMTFPGNPSPVTARAVRDSLEVNNLERASGGEDAPTIDDLKELIPSARNSQERLVTRSDLLARVYTMPSNFGRVFRAAIRPNPNNPLSIQLHVISRDTESRLITSPDTLKLNLKTYLNPYRMISDAIEVLDIRVLDIQVYFEVFVDPSLNRTIVLQSCIDVLKEYFKIENWQPDQPINISNVWNTLLLVPGVLGVNYVSFVPVSGVKDNLVYGDEIFDIDANTKKNFIMTPPEGGASIFEVRYPDADIVGRAV